MGNADSIPVELRHRVFNLVIQARNNVGNLRSDALREIWLLTENDDYKIPLCDPSLQFLPLIRDILQTSLNDQISLKNTIACICNLSTHQQNKMVICDPQLGILQALVNLMDETNGVLVQDTNAKKWLYTTLSNCALNPITHPYLLADSNVRYLEVLKTEMERDPSYLPPIKSFGCISLSLPNHYAHLIINLRVHEIIVNRLMTFGPFPSQWQDRNTGMAYWSLNFITAFSGLPEGRKALRALNKVDYFLQLLSCTEMEGIKASIITSNIFVQEDVYISSPLYALSSPSSSSQQQQQQQGGYYSMSGNPINPTINPTSSVLATKSLLESFPQLFPTLMDVYSATLDFDANRSEVKSLLSRGFGYAIVKMRDLSATLRNLSISSDKNKEIMLNHPSTLLFVLKSINLFIDNKPELNAIYHNYREYAGGGGKDYETINYLMELLLQLSFYYKNDELLLKYFLKPVEYNMIAMLQSFLSLSYDRNVPYEATQYANLLLKRLLPLQPLSTIPQHIMLSYARNLNSNNAMNNYQPLLSSLGKRLRDMGYDVWKPDEGSYLLSNNTCISSSGYYTNGFDDYMDIASKAIDHSYMVIICITPEYPMNYYCKMEAKYAKIRQRDHDVKIAYVMLNKDYTLKPNQMHSTIISPNGNNPTASNNPNNNNNNNNNPQANPVNSNNNNNNNPTTNHNHNSISQNNNTNNNNNNSNLNNNNANNSNNNMNNGQYGSCDGWLGMMIGSDQWYPLWETSHIENTVNSLAAIAGNNAKLERNKQILQTRSLPISQGVQTDPIDFMENQPSSSSSSEPMDWSNVLSITTQQKQLTTMIWNQLNNINTFHDESSFQQIRNEFNRIGVQEANDLIYLSEELQMNILNLCKEIPRIKLLKAFQQLKENN